MSALIELRDVTFAYPGAAPVLAGADLMLAAGERVCVTGVNGAGKSTLLRLIVGLNTPQAGQIVAFGQSRRVEADFREVRRLAGLVFQDPDDQLFCPTVAEDVAFGPLNLGKTRAEAVSIVDDVLSTLGLNGFQDRVTHKLSGGEKRLVTLAAVLAMNPEVLLLDEPSNALDEAATERLVEVLQNLPQAMIVVSHDPHFRRKVANRTLHLSHGRLNAPEQPNCGHALSTCGLAAVPAG